MKNEKLKKADVLLDAFGEIDDIYLAEALLYKKRRRLSTRLLPIAATLILSFILILCATVGLRLTSKNDMAPANPESNDVAEGEVRDNLHSFLMSLSSTESFTHIENESDLPYMSGDAYIVWQYEGESGYYLSEKLSYSNIEYIKTQIGRGEQVGGDSPNLKCKIWILLGDGRVVTPYLKANAGNISSAVFDYEAEIIPTDSFVNKIASILS